jgi:prephenate dehydrogenase
MSVQITIVGLGQIGTSIGLALRERNVTVRRVGHDKNPQVARESEKAGAVDDVKYNLPASVRDAQIVILALPLTEMRETLKVIAEDLPEGSLVLETAPAKASVAAWAQELLPAGRYYIGLTPAINPEYLHSTEFGVKAARADLFERGVMVVNTPPGTPENVFNLAMELVSLLGAKPLVMDTAEADGVFSAMHILPQLAAAALLGATVDKPGWQEARKLAGRPYASVTASVAYNDDVYSLGESALNNRENVVRLLNTYIASLISLRDEIEANQREAILERLEGAVRGRVRWLDERIEADWLKGERQEIDAPSFGERVGQMLFGGLMTNATRPKQK